MSLTEQLFNLIKKTGEFASEMAVTYREERRVMRSSYYGSMARLEKRGLIEKRKKQKRTYYTLTDKGRKFKFPKRSKQENRADGYSTVIIFDIPETMSRQRTVFRRYLIRNGYTLLQKSVLISPNKFSDETKELIEELNIRPYLSVLSSKIHYY